MKVIQQSKEYVVIHKPAGWVTYGDSKEQESISAKAHLEKKIKKTVFPVHRIDKDTCGLLTFALSPGMAKNLTALFRTRVVKKKYLAVVHGRPPEKGQINEPLERNKEKIKEPASTDFICLKSVEVVWEGENRVYSLVRAEPSTGRYHQIRRHLRFLGHPIVGDPIYGNTWDNQEFQKRFSIKRTLLSATHLAFPDREAQKMVRIETRPDPDFLRVVAAFGW